MTHPHDSLPLSEATLDQIADEFCRRDWAFVLAVCDHREERVRVSASHDELTALGLAVKQAFREESAVISENTPFDATEPDHTE